ncbi:MAG: hypothetical protein ACE5FO_03180 [Parvularculaceae bacterium]
MRTLVTIGMGLVLAGSLAACARVWATVEVFHDLPPDYVGKTITIVAADPAKAGTVETRTYDKKLADKLAAVGWKVVSLDPENPPDYVAAFGYGMDAQQATTYLMSGSYSGTADSTAGHVSARGSYSGAATPTTRTDYHRAFVVNIVAVPQSESKKPQQVYMVTVTSTGRCLLSTDIDPILEDVFRDFPGESGRARTVIIKKQSRARAYASALTYGLIDPEPPC